jgi:hypothetical protein
VGAARRFVRGRSGRCPSELPWVAIGLCVCCEPRWLYHGRRRCCGGPHKGRWVTESGVAPDSARRTVVLTLLVRVGRVLVLLVGLLAHVVVRSVDCTVAVVRRHRLLATDPFPLMMFITIVIFAGFEIPVIPRVIGLAVRPSTENGIPPAIAGRTRFYPCIGARTGTNVTNCCANEKASDRLIASAGDAKTPAKRSASAPTVVIRPSRRTVVVLVELTIVSSCSVTSRFLRGHHRSSTGWRAAPVHRVGADGARGRAAHRLRARDRPGTLGVRG